MVLGVGLGLARRRPPLPRAARAQLGARAPARHAGLHPRVRHHRDLRRRRSRADVVARPVRPRRLVPRGPLAARRHHHAHPHALPVRVPAGAGGAARPGGDRGAGRPHARRLARRGGSPRRPADAATGHRRRRGDRRHGDADRLRDGAVLQPGDHHRRRLPHLAGQLRPRRGQRDRHARARVRPVRHRARAHPARAGPLRRVGRRGGRASSRSASAAGAPSPPPPARRSVVTVAFVAPTLRLATWAIDEQRSVRGTPMVERYVDFLGNSLTLTAVTVAICLPASAIVANAHRFTSARVVRYASRISIVGYAVPGPVVAMGVVLTLVGGRRPARARRAAACPASPPPDRSSRSPTPTRSASSRPA